MDMNESIKQLLTEDIFDSPQAKEVVSLPLNELRANPYQPRKQFNEEALQELAQSIKENGVFQPIIVRPSAIKGYEIIAGERRFRASQRAGQQTVPALIYPCDDETMMQIAVVENLQREDLTPLEEAASYRQLMEELHLTQQELAQRLGKSRPYIANYLRLLSLPEKLKEMVQRNDLSVGHARALLSLPKKEEQLYWAKRVVSEKLTVRELETIINDIHQQESLIHEKKIQEKQKQTELKFYRESERQLQDYFDTKVMIKPKGTKGTIEIEYQSLDELNHLLAQMGVNLD